MLYSAFTVTSLGLVACIKQKKTTLVEAASQVCSKTSLDLRTLQQALVECSGDLWQLGTELGILDSKLQNIRCDFANYKRQTLEILG